MVVPIKEQLEDSLRQRVDDGRWRRRGRMAMRDHDSKVVLFEDVAGIDQAKVELTEVVDFFLKPEKFKASGERW